MHKAGSEADIKPKCRVDRLLLWGGSGGGGCRDQAGLPAGLHEAQDRLDGWPVPVDQRLQLRDHAHPPHPHGAAVLCRRGGIWGHHAGERRRFSKVQGRFVKNLNERRY